MPAPASSAHRLPERQTVDGGTAFDRFKFIECPAQTFVIDFDPLAADQRQPIGMRQKRLISAADSFHRRV